MTTKLLHIEEESLDIQITEKLGLIIRDVERDCEIEVSPEITAKLLSFASVIMSGIVSAQKSGMLGDMFSPDWK